MTKTQNSANNVSYELKAIAIQKVTAKMCTLETLLVKR